MVARAAITTNADSLPQFDAEGKLISEYEEETAFRTIRSGAASVKILSSWTQQSDSSLVDPVQGSAATLLRFSKSETTFKKTRDLGRAEEVPLARALNLDTELARADMVAAARRMVGGTEYYEYDLAVPAKECVPELATACLPIRVTLLSCCVANGALHVVQVDANPAQWRRSGKALKNLRSTFVVELAEA